MAAGSFVPPTPGTPSVPAPSAKAAAPAPAPPPPPEPRTGDLVDQGAIVRPSIRARSWNLSGRAKIGGAVELDQLTVRGDLSVAGSMTADRIDSEGQTFVDGEGKGRAEWKLHGETRFGGSVSVGSLVSTGRFDVRGALRSSGDVVATGSLDVSGELSGASVRIDGAVNIGGAATATKFLLTVRGSSTIGAIKAGQVVVGRKASPFDRDPPVLNVLEIEADEVDLTGVVAQYVKAARVRIGPGCRLAQVDGTIVARDPHSHVGPQVKSKPPHGLTR